MEENTGKWEVLPEMPHDTVMDKKGLEYNDLSATVQRDIKSFDVEYEKALKDGLISDEEYRLLTTKSFEIAKKIENEHPDHKIENDNGNGAGTAVVVVFVGILAAFGLGKLLQS